MRKQWTRRVVMGAAAIGAILAGCAPAPPATGNPAAAAAGSAAAPAPAPRGPLHPLIFYLPNRLVDLFDIVSVGVAVPGVPQLFPATVHVNAHVTRAIQIGAGTTHGTFLGKGYHRRFTWGLYHDEISVGPLTVAHLRFSPASASEAEVDRVGMLSPEDPPFATGYMDYWAVGVHAGVLPLAVSLDVHPAEIADALLGFFLIDIAHDDY